MSMNHSGMMFKKGIFLLLLSLACLAVLVCGCGGSKDKNDTSDEIRKDDQGPGRISDLKNFNAYTLKGNLYTSEMFADYDATIIFYWAPWSDVSLYELRNVGALYDKLPENVYGTTVCLDSESGNPKKILEDSKMSNVRTFTGGDADFATVCDEIANVPTMIIVNNEGKVVAGPIIGVQEDFEEVYLKNINKAMKKAKKDPIELVEEEPETEASTETTEASPEEDEPDSDTSEEDQTDSEDEDEDSGDSSYDSSDEEDYSDYDSGEDEDSDYDSYEEE